MHHLPTDLLRTFVTVAELGGFTSAGTVVGRSQPAVSLQIKRLEGLVGVSLLERSARGLKPTAEGETMLRYAREILALNDEALARLTRPKLAGGVRLGIPNEFASSFLPEILGKFAQSHPNVTLEVRCALSTELLERIGHDELDLVFALHGGSEPVTASEGWTEELVWVASPNSASHTRNPLPLIVAPEGCVYRGRIMEVLGQREAPWQVVYTSPSFGGIRAGVLAGLGVTVLSRSVVPEGLRTLPPSGPLPELPPVQVRLHYDRGDASDAVLGLVEYMATNLERGRAGRLGTNPGARILSGVGDRRERGATDR